jgi:hypothetical protein
LDKIIINNINWEKKKCNIELNEIKCLIEENLNINDFNGDEINIEIKNKMIKVKKIYYRIEKIKNKLILNILSKEKFIIKIFDKLIESIDNKYEIKNNNEEIINIEIYNKNKIKIELKNRDIKFFEELDITIIEIKEIDNIIKDIEFLDYDLNYIKGYKQYLNKDIFSLQYPKNGIEHGSGKIIEINEYEFTHTIDTENGSSGSPIILPLS